MKKIATFAYEALICDPGRPDRGRKTRLDYFMDWRKGERPTILVRQGRSEAAVDVRTARVVFSDIDPLWIAGVEGWVRRRREELLARWREMGLAQKKRAR